MGAPTAAGHRSMPHTADVRIEAWGPSREACTAEAVAAMVDGFADVTGAPTVASVDFRIPPGSDEDLLAGVLDQVIYLLDTTGQLPIGADVAPCDGGVDVRLRMTGTEHAELVGAVPKAVSLHELRVDHSPDGGWSCAATLDV
ncbi:archease [Micromonospora sp. NPDC049559]|uniref:archease n=1 Tax=Micromonospora sp. NPDC049559 TaxID=3155923 RepID=UPI00341B7755